MCGGMVLMYAVFGENGMCAPERRALSIRRFEQVVRALGALALEHGLERVEPLLGFERVGVVRCGELGDGGHCRRVPVLAAGGRG